MYDVRCPRHVDICSLIQSFYKLLRHRNQWSSPKIVHLSQVVITCSYFNLRSGVPFRQLSRYNAKKERVIAGYRYIGIIFTENVFWRSSVHFLKLLLLDYVLRGFCTLRPSFFCKSSSSNNLLLNQYDIYKKALWIATALFRKVL